MIAQAKEIFHRFYNLERLQQLFKKGYKGSKDNYRPVSIPPIISKRLKNVYVNKLHCS